MRHQAYAMLTLDVHSEITVWLDSPHRSYSLRFRSPCASFRVVVEASFCDAVLGTLDVRCTSDLVSISLVLLKVALAVHLRPYIFEPPSSPRLRSSGKSSVILSSFTSSCRTRACRSIWYGDPRANDEKVILGDLPRVCLPWPILE